MTTNGTKMEAASASSVTLTKRRQTISAFQSKVTTDLSLTAQTAALESESSCRMGAFIA